MLVDSAVWRRYINVCNCDMFSVVNVYLDHFCVVCIDVRRYVCCSECNVVSNEITPCLVQPIGTHGSEDMHFGFVCFSFLNCDDICMCVVDNQFELLEFVFDFVYVDLRYDEISLTSIAGSVSLWCVCSHVVVFGLAVRLSWYPMWMQWLLWLWCVYCCLCCMCVCWESDVNAGVWDGWGVVSVGYVWLVHVVQVLCLAQLTWYGWEWCVGWEELGSVWEVYVFDSGRRGWWGVSGWEDWFWALPILWNMGSVGRVFGLRWWGVGRGLGPWSGGWGYVCMICESGFSV